MSRRLIEMQFPVAGLDRSMAYRAQPPFSTPDAQNVWPVDSIEGRSRGGSRPGLSKLFSTQLGSGNPIRLLKPLSIVDTTGFCFWSDQFDGESLSGIWSAGWGGTAPSVTEDFTTVSYNTTVRAVRDALDPVIDTTQAYKIELSVVPYDGQHCGTYRIFARMNDSSPNAETEGVIAELTVTGSTTVTTSGSIKIYSGGVLQATLSFTTTSCPTVPVADVFSLYVSGTTYKAYFAGVELVSGTNATALTGKRVGFGMTCSVSGGFCLTDTFRVQYYKSTTRELRRTLLVASSNGKLYKESWFGEFSEVSSSLTLASDRQLEAIDREQMLFIADNGDVKSTGTAGTIASVNQLSKDGGGLDWTTLGIDTDDDVVVITDHSSTGDGVFPITSVNAGYLVLGGSPVTGTCHWRVERSPKKYDPISNIIAHYLPSTAGIIPVGCRLIAMYRGRVVLASSPEYPHQWWMSRADDPYDWLDTLDEDDATRPISGDSEASAGMVGEPLTAVVPLSDDYLVFGCQNSLHLMRGDPAYGGELDNVSRECGIVARGAYAVGPQCELVFLSRDGLKMFLPGQPIKSLSRERLPRELIDVDVERFTISMRFDVRNRGVHIFLSGKDKAKRRHWWFDMTNGGFWPMKFQDDHEPFAACWYPSLSSENVCMAVGCRDGYVRRFHENNDLDDTSEVESYVYYGPFAPGGSQYLDGTLTELVGILDDESGDVDWSVHTGDAVESAYKTAALADGTWSGGRNYNEHPRVRGAALFVKLANGEKKRWAVDSLIAWIESGGMAKRA